MTQQLNLSFGFHVDLSFTNFYVADNNQQVIEVLKNLKNDDLNQFVFVWGERGVGRSHLLQATCADFSTQGLRVAFLPLHELKNLNTGLLEDLEQLDLICLDDVDSIATDKAWEEGLFHLYNRVLASGAHCVFAGSQAPAHLDIQLPDLKSRLQAATCFQLHALADSDKMRALQLQAKVRGINLSETVAQFLLRHFKRSMPELYSILETLDQASLQYQRPLTIPFIKEILDI